MRICDDVPRAAEIALDAMGDRLWTDLTLVVEALRENGFEVTCSADIQPAIDALFAQGAFKPQVMSPGGLGSHPDRYAVYLSRA